jgi:hypothetical protein
MTTTMGWIILGIVNIPVYFGLRWLIFDDWDNFLESIRFWLTPDIFSLLNGEYWEDWWGEMKLGAWVVASIGCVFGEALLIAIVFG